MSSKNSLFRYLNAVKSASRELGRHVLLYVSLVSILLSGLSAITACKRTELYVPLIIPLDYADCVELSPQKLGYYYFDYNPIYSWLPDGDEVLTGRSIIMKNIEITEEILKTRTKSSIKVTNSVKVESHNFSKIEQLKVGDVVDVLGLSKGISDEESVVILEKCFIEPPGRLNLPLDYSESQNLMGY